MALTKKQIKQLRAMANSLKPLFYVGKNDLTESAVNQAGKSKVTVRVLHRLSQHF